MLTPRLAASCQQISSSDNTDAALPAAPYVACTAFIHLTTVSLRPTAEEETPNGGSMKIKPARKESLLRKRRGTTRQGDLLIVKTESQVQLDDKEANQANSNGLDPNIQIKEEPDLHAISEEHNGDISSLNIKDEPDSDPQPECEFSNAAVKSESEASVKEEDEGEEVRHEGEGADNIQEDADGEGGQENHKG